ncbi:hypothetical protein M2138_000469 [Dysgonomonadaceae bacterium PH5-43]|nr:hypothetical protein [Dysgonomonadaceae bacterium PH5-43]
MNIPFISDNRKFFEASIGDITTNSIACVNWSETYPYKPEVKFAIAHDNTNILLRFFVKEQSVMAMVTEDNGAVWTDSCVEFFINFDESGYYNFEFNCIGAMLLGFRKEKNNATHADSSILHDIERHSSLGNTPFTEKQGEQEWELAVKIPVTSFFKHSIKSLSGLNAKANFYKCGDNLSVPHFLSWNPIDNPTPNFHLEKYFKTLIFE